jgi:uncharacterized protein YjbJ (UPF0337 family)
MDKDRVKGKIDDAAGRAKRQVGEWTGDTKAQVEGAAQQVKGKVENAWGKTKDAVRDVKNDMKRPHDADVKRPGDSYPDEETEREREEDVA